MKKLGKVLAVFMIAVMAIGTLSVTASAEGSLISKKTLTSGKKVSGMLKSRSDWYEYNIKVAEKGTLEIKYSITTQDSKIYVYNEDGANQKVKKVDVAAGSVWEGGEGYDYFKGRWNKSSEKFTGTVSYSLKKGSYTIVLQRTTTFDGDEGKFTLTAKFPSDDPGSAKIKNLGLRMDKGDSVKLLADTDPADADIVWSSSKEAVATVSESGKVTAQKAGTAIITAKCGGSSQQFKIVVE